LYDGQTLALVGESGSGKSLTALTLMRLLARNARWQCTGQALLRDGAGQTHDLLTVSAEQMRQLRGNRVAMIFQEPMTCLNPVLPVGEQIAESVRLHRGLDASAARAQALRALEQVEIPAARQRLDEYPHQLSGGMRQRVMIAMALICDPELLIADEPSTALDVTVQAQILDLLQELRTQEKMSIVMITHDLGVVAGLCSKVMVMYAGEFCEKGAVGEIFHDPQHPYTRGLVSSIPRLDKAEDGRLTAIPGSPPNLQRLPKGCTFQERCTHVFDRCIAERPVLTGFAPDRAKSCHLKGFDSSGAVIR
jgi:oligopeptide/dipeptide ABC transporter ATP-binding protein